MSDVSKHQPQMTAGLDLGDKYSYLCLIDSESGEVMEEGRLRTTPEALRRRFASVEPSLRIAIEAGTHSPWVSRLLEECGHEVLVANARLEWTRSYSTHSSTGAKRAGPTWRSSARARRWSGAARSS